MRSSDTSKLRDAPTSDTIIEFTVAVLICEDVRNCIEFSSRISLKKDARGKRKKTQARTKNNDGIRTLTNPVVTFGLNILFSMS